jgi:biopolymer transport protein TolR
MAMQLGGGAGGGRGRGRYRPLAEINVTPLVDVMLVLLIIFMVTAPLMSSAVNVDLPKASASPVSQDNEPITVSIDATGHVFMGDTPVDLPDLVTRLQAVAKDQKDRRILVRGDKANSYGRVIEVMGTIVQGGFTKVALLSEEPAGGAAPAGAPAAVPEGAPASAPPAAPAAPARPGNG